MTKLRSTSTQTELRHLTTSSLGVRARVVEEAGAEEGYRRDGTLAWRRLLRRRSTEYGSAPSPAYRAGSSRSAEARPGLLRQFIDCLIGTQLIYWLVAGGLVLGKSLDPAGAGAFWGYIAASLAVALFTVILARS